MHEPEETLDTLFGGRLQVFQKKRGYRFSIDALLLASFIRPRPGDRIIDLGTGCGIIPLLLALRSQTGEIVGVETQPSLADLARRNVDLNRFPGRITILEEDLKNLGDGTGIGTFDLALSNPPYRKAGTGRINPLEEKALARHEIRATLEDVLRASQRILRRKGRVAVIYPASRAGDLIQGMRELHLEPKRLQFVHSRLQERATLMLLESCKEGRTELEVLPPLGLFDAGGKYTPEAQGLFHDALEDLGSVDSLPSPVKMR